MLKYPTNKELDEWEAQTSGEKPLMLQKGQLANALQRTIFRLRVLQDAVAHAASFCMEGDRPSAKK